MAKPNQKAVELEELVRKSEAARLEIGQAKQVLSHRLDLPARFKESLKAQPIKWIGGAILTGFVGTILLKPRKKRARIEGKALKKRKTSSFKFLRFLIAISKPAVKIYATKLLKEYLEGQVARGRGKRSFGLERPPH